MKSIEDKIHNLRKKLRQWEYLYYVKNKSAVPNEKYDAILEELNQLELQYPNLVKYNSPTCTIGNVLENDFSRVYHKVPMLSLNSIVEKSKILIFDKRIRLKLRSNNSESIVYCCELKLDGVAISLLYKNGKLIQAATRGNGIIGEDVTKNARTIASIPIFLKDSDNGIGKLPNLLEIRGEVFIQKSDFLKLNQNMLKIKSKPFSNARNAASGSLRHLDANVTALRPLVFCCYGISYYFGDQELPISHWERLKLCNNWGIEINRYTELITGIDKVLQYYSYIKEIRNNLEYNIDGIVIKVDSCDFQVQLGVGFKAPYWAIAYKFPSEKGFTKLNNVIFQVGRTGLITPIACVNSVTIDNVIIKRISMHNVNEIKRLNLMLGDTVLIQRSGDVIPKILKVILEKRTDLARIIKLPQFCPVCSSVLEVQNSKSNMLYCPARLTCLAQRKAALRHFVSRKAMNICGMGEKIIDKLVNRNLVSVPVDFFYLDYKKLLSLDGYKIKSVERLLRSISLAKDTTLSSFIYALGIPNVGISVSYSLAIKYRTIENFLGADLHSLCALKNVGESIAMHIYNFLRDPYNIKNIMDLIDPKIGIKFNKRL